MKDTDLYFCDKCGKPIDKDSEFECVRIDLCSACAAKLYQKIFGTDQEDEQ